MAEESWRERDFRIRSEAARARRAEDARQKARPIEQQLYGSSYLDGDLQRRRQIATGIAQRPPAVKRR